MQSSLVNKAEITAYIPQKAPIVMIDTLDYCEGTVTRTSFQVSPGNIFVENGVMREPGIIENIAQSAAARAGYEVKKLGKEPVVGFIGAVKDLRIQSFPKVGEIIKTEIVIKAEVMDVTIIQGTSRCGEKMIAECEMKIFLQKPQS
jgi:predicted hotdog family 3-hydroxylacyl-ACP dehydratase